MTLPEPHNRPPTASDDDAPNPTSQPPRRGLPLPLGRLFWLWILLGLIGLVFIVEQSLPLFVAYLLPHLPADYQGLSPSDFRGGSENTLVLILLGANYRPFIAAGQVWRFFSSMFLHIGVIHLAFNGYALFIFGGETERLYGGTRFIVIYILSGLFGSLFSYAFSSATVSAGASGAIFGIIGVQLAYFYRYRALLGDFGRSRLSQVLVILGINLVFGFTMPGIDNFAHLGGLVSGMILGYTMAPIYQVQVDEISRQARVADTSTVQATLIPPLVGFLLLFVGTWAVLWGPFK